MRILNLVCVIVALSMTGCYQYIDSGNVGVRVNASGTNKGIDPKPLGVGRAWYNPFTEQIHEFPVFEQNVLWQGAEAITFSSDKGSQVTADVGLTFDIEDEQVPVLFGKLRKDIEYISHNWLRNHVREAISAASEHMDVMLILGEGKTDLLTAAKDQLNKDMKEYGITIKMLSFASAPKPEAKIQASIDATIAAKQNAIQAENKVAQSKAEAQQHIEESRGKAEAMILEAKGKLEQTKLVAEGNKVLSESITEDLIRYTAARQWDGKLPNMVGQGAVPMFNLNGK